MFNFKIVLPEAVDNNFKVQPESKLDEVPSTVTFLSKIKLTLENEPSNLIVSPALTLESTFPSLPK